MIPMALAASTSATTTAGDGSTSTSNPNRNRCSQDVVTYLGGAADPRFGWSVLIGDAAAVGPAVRQRMSGQTWIACVITPANGISATSTSYIGSVRNALTVGALPSPFSSCTQFVVVADFAPDPCDQPHRLEVFGEMWLSPGASQAHLDASCLQLIRWLMRSADPTKGGLLTVRTAAAHADPTTGVSTEGLSPNGESSKAVCFVGSASVRKLLGTLVGLGTNPVAWA